MKVAIPAWASADTIKAKSTQQLGSALFFFPEIKKQQRTLVGLNMDKKD